MSITLSQKMATASISLAVLPEIQRFSRHRAGTTGFEYALIAGALGLVLVSLYSHFGQKLHATFATDFKAPVMENH